MHQLAVVGGGRNANGVPGVFGPADGRGQSCMFLQRLHFCVCFYGHKTVYYTPNDSPVPISIGSLKELFLYGDLSVQNEDLGQKVQQKKLADRQYLSK